MDINWSYSPETPNLGQIRWYFESCDFEIWQMTLNKANLRDLIAATGLVILLKLDSNRRFFSPCHLEIWWMTPKNNRAPLLCYFKLFASFLAATKQLYDWFSPSVCPSHLFHHVPIIVSSWNFQELLPWSEVMSMQKVKVRGQRSRSQRSTPNLAFSGL